MNLRVATLVLFVLGVGLLFPFESPVTLTLGVLFLLAFIACGVLALAGPGSPMLDPGEEEPALRRRREPTSAPSR